MRILRRSDLRFLPKLEWLIDGVIPDQSLGCIWGKPESFKSFLGISMACAISTGEDWLGHPVKKVPVLYVVAEGLLDFNSRIEGWEKRYTEEVGDELAIIGHSVHFGDDNQVSDFLNSVNTIGFQPGLICVDTWSRCLGGVEENNASSVEGVLRNLERIKGELGCGILVVHHGARTTGEMRGSIALKGALDYEYEARREDGSACVWMNCRKFKSAKHPAGMEVRMEPSGDSLVAVSPVKR